MKKAITAAVLAAALAASPAQAFKLKDGGYISGGKVKIMITTTIFTF